MEFVQAVYTSVNQAPESNLLALIDDLKSKAPQFDINDIEADHTLLNNAAGIVGRPFGHGKFYTVASKFAHPTASSFM